MSKNAVTEPKMKKIPVGVSNFNDMIEGSYYYVDKSIFIKEVIDKGDKILLIPRPRRFGKTLNLSMLKCFFDCCPRKPGEKKETGAKSNKKLFDSLAIAEAGKEYLEHMGKYPVIFLTFKDIKELDWNSCLDKIKQLIQARYLEHLYLLKSPGLKPQEKNYFKRIIELTGSKIDYENSLGNLLVFLNRYYVERAVILIDEYDEPVHAGYNYGYYNEVINFLRNFLSGGLKDTGEYLEKSVITGTLRIAKESIFSGFNNPGVYTLLREDFDEKFGFTETEIVQLLEDFDLMDRFGEVKEWYNGYRFGKKVIYNPWSIINFLAGKGKECLPYWVNTTDNKIVEDILSNGGKELKKEIELLIRGETIEKSIDEHIVLTDVKNRDNVLWSFLLMGGYLKYTAWRYDPFTSWFYYTLEIPNREVRTTYSRVIDSYFSTKIENENLKIMLDALVSGDVDLFEHMLRKIVLTIFSYHDFSNEPEKVYHALVMGLLVWLNNTHEIKSNRESGYGRYDIIIIPRDTVAPGLTGYVIEFKAVRKDKNEDPESAIRAALKQIEDKRYENELIERGIKNIKKLAIVFSGKDVYVKENNNS